MQRTTESEVTINKPEPVKKWAYVQIGAVVNISGVDCKLVNVNQGKRRLTFTPVDPEVPVPGALRDPVWIPKKEGAS